MDLRKTTTSHRDFSCDEYYYSRGGRLLGYVRVHHLVGMADVAHIIDTVSARAFDTLSPKYRDIFINNGFIPHAGDSEVLRGVGMDILERTLENIQVNNEDVRMAIVLTRESTRLRFEASLFRHFSNPPSYIEKVSGGGDGVAATILFHSRAGVS